MKKLALALALGLSAFASGAAFVPPAAAQVGSDASHMTPDMMVQIRNYMGRTTSPVVSNLTATAGSTVPDAVELRSFPNSMNLSAVRYVRTSNGLVVVDARTRRVLQVVQ
jgi:C4-dicarboxylate transporter